MINGRRLALLAAIIVLSALLMGCRGEGSPGSAAVPAPAQTVDGARSVRCGCSIENVGTCGNYVEFEGEYVELEFPEELDPGEMAFCGQDDLMAQVEGELSDGKFVVTSFEYVE